MRLINLNVTLFVLFLTGPAFSSDYSEVYTEVENSTYAIYQENINDKLAQEGMCARRTFHRNIQKELSFFDETDTSFGVNILFSTRYTVKYGYNFSGKCMTLGIDNSRIAFSPEIECLFTSSYELRCLYRDINVVDTRDDLGENSQDELFSRDFRDEILYTIENIVSEIY